MFRAQALRHAGARSYGTVLLARPVSYSFLTLLFVLIGAGIVAFFVLCDTTRKARVPGVLLPSQGLIRVASSQAGVIAERRVQEGQPVKAGEVLFVVRSERASTRDAGVESAIGVLLQARRDSLSGEQQQLRWQASQRMESAQRRIEDLAQEGHRIEQQSALQERRVALAAEAVQRVADLQRSGFMSPAQVRDKQAELLDQQQRFADLRRVKAANEREAATLRDTVRDLQLQAKRDLQAGERNIAAIEQDLAENEARRETLVRAPQDGTVSAITGEPGQSATLGLTLASLLPAGSRLEAELYAPSRSAGFVKPGMEVLLRYQAYPYQKFGQARGRVREVSATAMPASELPMPGAAATASGEPLYRIRVALERQTVTAYAVEQPLKSGAALEASVLLDKRRLIEWVLEPLYSLKGRV